ncbi:MAG TPA: hypothetical protein VG937_36325 [Polyangiaceae bacterium]|jgi:integrase|nr:hypothetical protein [Polyangiaceae bacterium]
MIVKKGGRPRKGYLEFRGGSWHAQLTITVDGERVRKWFNLETDSKPIAKRKLARLVKEHGKGEAPSVEAVAADAAREETVPEAVRRIVARQGEEGLKSWKERLSRLERYAVPLLEKLSVKAVRPLHVREVLDEASKAGLSKQSVIHVRNDLSAVFGDLWRDEVITENPVKRVKLPKNLRVDGRGRVILSDAEFAHFMAASGVPEHVHLMALASRSFGGMRTSDLHAWDWSHVDTQTWQSAEVYRPKTDGPEASAVLERLALPEMLQAPLAAWWSRQPAPKAKQGPTEGPVFPVRKGKRAGERQTKRSHARELRFYLWRAGVHRPLEGFAEALATLRTAQAKLAELRAGKAKGEVREGQWAAAAALAAAQALDAIQSDTERSLCADFHSFRRAFNTALGAAGINVQQAMALAGHKDARTHLRYVDLGQRGALEMPLAALPTLSGWGQDIQRPPRGQAGAGG